VSRRGALWTLGTPVRLLLLGMIGLYRVSIGQVAGGRCRFHPTCSAYAYEAIRELGAVRGTALAAWRVLRCGPWTAGGIDYPPKYEAVIHWSGKAPLYDGAIQESALEPHRAGGAGTR
jgi:putative membrane protein insertion efficiency factor